MCALLGTNNNNFMTQNTSLRTTIRHKFNSTIISSVLNFTAQCGSHTIYYYYMWCIEFGINTCLSPHPHPVWLMQVGETTAPTWFASNAKERKASTWKYLLFTYSSTWIETRFFWWRNCENNIKCMLCGWQRAVSSQPFFVLQKWRITVISDLLELLVSLTTCVVALRPGQ